MSAPTRPGSTPVRTGHPDSAPVATLPRRRWWQGWRAYPRIALALKTASAAAIAWLVVQPLGGFTDNYPYYAPLGAVVATSLTVTSSFRAATQAAVAIALGATAALTTRELPIPEVAALALVVGVGTLVAGWRWLGAMSSWVPVSALFILIIGGRDPAHYVLAYLGLTTLGAMIGVGINLLVPSLPLTPTGLALRRVRLELAEQLEEVADGLRHPDAPTAEEWAKRRHTLSPHIDRMRALVRETSEARRANWRARRWRESADRQYSVATVLDDLAALTNQIVSLIIERERADKDEPALGTSLRPHVAEAFSSTARVLEVFDDPEQYDRASADMERAVEELRRATSTDWRETGEDRYTAATIVTALERAAGGLSVGHPSTDD